MKTNPRLLDPSIYPHSFVMHPRFSDLDTQKHLNNSRLTEFFQEARVSFNALLERDGFKRPAGTRGMVAHLSIDYLSEVLYPEPVTMRIGVLQIGRTSYQFGIALFTESRCAALAKVVMVNNDANGPAPLTDQWRELLSRYLLPTA